MRNLLLIAGIAIPVVYLANLFGVGAMTPGFDQSTTLPSELGRDGMANAALFNAGLIAVGACGVLADLGLFSTRRDITGAFILSSRIARCFLACATVIVVYGVFPHPDERHHSLDILLIASMFAHVFGALALKHSGADRWIVLVGFVA